MAEAFKPSAEATRVIALAKLAGIISQEGVDIILGWAARGDVASFNAAMSALASQAEAAGVL